jgi:hypothetical protein
VPNHSEIIGFTVKPNSFGGYSSEQYVDHSVKTARQISQHLPAEVVKVTHCRFSVDFFFKRPMATFSVQPQSHPEPVEISCTSYYFLTDSEGLPEQEELAEKLVRHFLDSLQRHAKLGEYIQSLIES